MASMTDENPDDPRRPEGESDVEPEETSSTDPEGPTLEALLESGELDPTVRAALESALEEAQARALQAEDRMLRAVAETENQRKRLAKEQAERIRFANENVLREMLGVLDSLELCFGNAGQDTDVEALCRGVELTLAQFRQALENAGAEPIVAEVGAPFDPKVHEAVLQDDTANLPERTIAKTLQSGFMYRDRVLRAARVVVSTGKGLRSGGAASG